MSNGTDHLSIPVWGVLSTVIGALIVVLGWIFGLERRKGDRADIERDRAWTDRVIADLEKKLKNELDGTVNLLIAQLNTAKSDLREDLREHKELLAKLHHLYMESIREMQAATRTIRKDPKLWEPIQ